MLVRRLYAWACERLYHELAWSYDPISWLVSGGHWDQWRTLALDYIQGSRVLEIGFGTGGLLPRLATRRGLTVGLELSPAMHHQTARKFSRLGVALPRVQARAQAMPFAKGAFDTLIATFPALYILETATLTECARLLALPSTTGVQGATGGRLVIVGLWVTIHANSGWERLIPLFYGRPSQPTLDRISTRFAAAGFRAGFEERAVGLFRVGVLVAERTGATPA